MIASSFFQRPLGPKVTYITNKQRRKDILSAASKEYGAWIDCAHCHALSDEPNMKWLLKKGYIELRRIRHYGWFGNYSRFTRAFITDSGRAYYATL